MKSVGESRVEFVEELSFPRCALPVKCVCVLATAKSRGGEITGVSSSLPTDGASENYKAGLG